MENQTRFDLNRAIEKWRKDLAAQSDLAVNEQQDLEKQLHDFMTEMSGRGLSTEDAFWLACRRLGYPMDSDEERAAKAPERIWGERIFWIALAVLGVVLWQHVSTCLATLARPGPHHWLELVEGKAGWLGQFAALFFPMLLNTLPVLLLAVLLSRGKGGKLGNAILQPLLRARRRLALVTSAATLLVVIASEYLLFVTNAAIPPSFLTQVIVQSTFRAIALPATLIALAIWLLPSIRPSALADSKSRLSRSAESRALPCLSEKGPDFCLDAAIQQWQSALAVQPGLTPEIQRELDAHLRDSLTELQDCGLGTEEAFCLSRWKLGQPQSLSEEFARADLARVWRGRVFWIAVVLLAVYLWESFWELRWPSLMVQRLNNGIEQSWVNFYLPAWVSGWMDTLSSWLRNGFFCTVASVVPIAWLAWIPMM